MQGQALIIEDSETQAKFIGRMIEREGWKFTIAKSMEAACFYLKQDLAISSCSTSF